MHYFVIPNELLTTEVILLLIRIGLVGFWAIFLWKVLRRVRGR